MAIEPIRVYAIGDIHGDFKPVRNFYEKIRVKLAETTEVVLVCLGDFGANYFFNHRDEEFKKKLGSYNITYFVIRGNHEERPEVCAQNAPEEWTQETYFGNLVWVEKKYPYIKYALDHPTAYLINKRLTFVIPGAYSVDKYHRLNCGMSWFEGEQLTDYERMKGRFLAENIEKCDIVLSHTCPICYEPTDLFLSVVDQATVDKTMERYLGEIETKLDYKLWCFGHFHALRVYPKWEHHQLVMLFNQDVLDIDCYFRTNDIYQSIIKII